MAISIFPHAKEAISLIDFISEMRAHDVSTEDGIAGASDLLAALNANKTLLVDHIIDLLRALRDDDHTNDYTGQTFMLHVSPKFYVRANMWVPEVYHPLQGMLDSKHFVYGMPHDHNFTFMTIGHLGAGYRTRIFEHDGINRSYNIGDRSDVRFLEDTTLPEGKVMIYRASRDVHQQYAPDELCVSLNIVTTNRTELARTQYMFRDDCSTVVNRPRGDAIVREDFFGLVPALATARTEELLNDLLESDNPSLRRHAQSALSTLSNTSFFTATSSKSCEP